ncbi:MAG: agmatinase [Bacteroidota bacterium]
MIETLGIKENFLGIEKEYSSLENSRVVIVPTPYERSVSYGIGAKRGPQAILKASHYVESYDEELEREVYQEVGIATLRPLDFGKKSDEKALQQIYKRVRALVDQGKFVVTLGGEHTISQASIAAHAEKYPDLSLLQLDAHSDLRDEYEGNKYSHASVMARVCEFFDPRKIVQVGIRAQCKEEASTIKEKGITTFYAHEIRRGKYTRLLKYWEDLVIEKLTDNVYVTFDVDAFDPSIMPATGTPEPNGLYWHETMNFFRKLGNRRKIVGFDAVELAPIEGLQHPDVTAAKLIYKILNYAM